MSTTFLAKTFKFIQTPYSILTPNAVARRCVLGKDT